LSEIGLARGDDTPPQVEALMQMIDDADDVVDDDADN
jgi:hypothetical protein